MEENTPLAVFIREVLSEGMTFYLKEVRKQFTRIFQREVCPEEGTASAKALQSRCA